MGWVHLFPHFMYETTAGHKDIKQCLVTWKLTRFSFTTHVLLNYLAHFLSCKNVIFSE